MAKGFHMRRWAIVLLAVFLSGCSTSTQVVVRLNTGRGDPIVHIPRRGVEPVAVSEEDFKKAVAQYAPSVPPSGRPLEHARQLFGVPERSGWYLYESGSHRLIASEPGNPRNLRLALEDAELTRRYVSWCGHRWGGEDCLRLLRDKPFLDGDDKYALAMAIAHSKALGAMKEELTRQISPEAIVATVVGGLTMYAILLALPEPVSKGVAALLTVGAIAYLGWDTVWRLIDGWLILMKEVERAATFDEIYASGEKFGDTMGEKAIRAFVMLATVALGNTASGMAATLPRLPGAGRAAVLAETQLNIRFTAPALAQVESVAISAEGATIALSPNAVAMAAQGSGGNTAGAQVQPPSSSGPGRWVKTEESMSESARNYQAQTTGAPKGYAYRVKWRDTEADFDGFDQGVLLEAKGTGYAQWLDDKLNFRDMFKGGDKLLVQARRQVQVANGTHIRWIVAEEKLAAALRKMFKEAGLEIEVIQVSPAPGGAAP